MFTYGNDATITSFNARFGGTSCAGGPKLTLGAETSIPRLACSAADDVLSWSSATVTVPSGSGLDVTSFRLTVSDSTGVPITGYTDVHPDSQGVVDLSALTAAQTGQSPTITVGAVGADVTQAGNTTITVKRQTDYPELCLELSVNRPCPTLAAGAVTNPVAVDPFALAGTAVETPTGGASSTATADATVQRGTLTTCTGRVAGTVRRANGQPAAGRALTLRSPSGTLLGSTTTKADGTYTFPIDLAPGTGYVVADATGTAKSGDVRADATTTIDFRVAEVALATTVAQDGADIVTTVQAPAAGTVTTTVRAGSTVICTASITAKRKGAVTLRCTLPPAIRLRACNARPQVTVTTRYRAHGRVIAAHSARRRVGHGACLVPTPESVTG